MRNVTADFGKYELEDIGQEFRSTADIIEKSFILPKTVGGTKVYLLLGVKNTPIQPFLIKVLSSGVGVYLSSFKDMWESRMYLPNKDQQRESNYAVYSLYNSDILGDSVNCRVEGGVRFDSKSKMKTSPL